MTTPDSTTPDVGFARAAASLLVAADEHGRAPALLLDWRETPPGWHGRVGRSVPDLEDEKWRPREEVLLP